jgi:hypothetical protein
MVKKDICARCGTEINLGLLHAVDRKTGEKIHIGCG